MTVTLSPAEIQQLTGYKRPADQLRELKRQGFYRARLSRAAGGVILERPHYDAVASGMVDTSAAGQGRPNAPKLRAVT